MSEGREHRGWTVRESGPADAAHAVLLLPGALGNAAFFDDLIAEPQLGSVRFVATALPGNAGAPRIDNLGIESCAAGAVALASEFGCDAVVGHSLGANVAIEMVASGTFSGPLVLLAPSLSREDESIAPRVLDKLGRALGTLPFALVLRLIGPMMKNELPEQRREALIAEMKKSDPALIRESLHLYLAYLDRHGSVAARLCESGTTAVFVLGDKDDVGITDAERAELAACERVTVVDIPGAGHFTLNEQPARIAELLAGVLS